MIRLIAFIISVSLPTVAAAEDPVPTASAAVGEVGVTTALRSWKTAYRKSSPTFAYGLTGGYMPLPWLAFEGALEHSRRSTSPGTLKITNSETWLTIGPRFSLWVDFLRLFAEVGGAAILRTASYHDADILAPARVSGGVSVGTGFSVVVAGRVAITMRGAWRRRDDQANILAGLDATWLFQP